MSKNKQQINHARQQFLLSFFKGECYQEKEVNNFMLIKNMNGNTGRWQVGIYTQDSFKRYKEVSNNASRLNFQIEKE